jgi:hypothetical protein
MTHIEIKNKYRPILNDLRIRSTGGDKQAAREYMWMIVEYETKLKEVGYRTSDNGHVIKRSKTWKLKCEREARKPENILREKARHGDDEATKELIRQMATGLLKP